MNAKQKALKERLLKERGYMCEHCYARRATDLHHALLGRDKRFKELDVEENFQCVCHYCHMSGVVDSKSSRNSFWLVQCRRYGEQHMLDWLDSLPLKYKPRFPRMEDA